MPKRSDKYLSLVSDECNRIVGNRMIPPAIADVLTRSDGGEKYQLFSQHPVALATLPLASFEAVGGSNVNDVATVGAAMEFLLTAGDVLDDLQDGDLRFEGNGAHANYVEKTELIAALLLLSEHAIISINSAKIPLERIAISVRYFSELKIRAFKSQYSDAHARDSVSTTPVQVLERTRLKSGSLGKCAGMLGATLATDDAESVQLASEFGEHLAIVFQLKNDIRDLWPDYGYLDDAASGKATAPTAFTLAVGDGEAGSTALSKLLEDAQNSPEKIEVARKETFDSGGMHFAMIQSFAHLARTKTIARQLEEKHRTNHLEFLLAGN